MRSLALSISVAMLLAIPTVIVVGIVDGHRSKQRQSIDAGAAPHHDANPNCEAARAYYLKCVDELERADCETYAMIKFRCYKWE